METIVTEYCERSHVLARLTTYGYAYAADREDMNGTVGETEEARYVDSAIAWAGTLLDELVSLFTEPAQARGQSNAWLRDRAIDLATWRAVTAGGRDAPASLQLSYQTALDAIERVRSGGKIPGLTLQQPLGPRQTAWQWPRPANVS